MIPDGSVVSYTGTWSRGGIGEFFESADGLVNEVSTRLTSAGLPVRNRTIDASIFNQEFTVTLQLQVENGMGFSTPDDIISVIRHWVYIVTGRFPTADSLPYVQRPGGGKEPTGQPKPGGTAPAGCISGSSLDTSGNWSFSCWWDNLTTKGLSTVGLLALAAAVGIGIFAFAVGRK